MPAEFSKIDCLIEARWVIPVEPEGLVLSNHAVALNDGQIVDILPAETALRQYGDAPRITLSEHALIPGLVNLHTHAAMSLMRGLADDLPLMQWLERHIWPAEARHVSPSFVHDGTLLACAEMLKGGTTTFNDMYFYPEAVGRAALTAGMRAAIGIIAIEFPTAYASDPDDYMHKGLQARDALKDQELLSFCMAPHAPYTVSDKTFERLLVMAEELDLPIHLHVHETAHEIQSSQSEHGKRPLERLAALGLVGPRLIAVHSVHMEQGEIDLYNRANVSVAHCPSSNLKLASGLAPVTAMLQQAINLGLGTDGAASNNRLDLFQEMRLAALLAKGTSGLAEAMPAAKALTAATLGGARALGLDARIGSICKGKAADLTAVRLNGPGLVPCYDPVSHLVYAAGRENVTDVWINGRQLLSEGHFTLLNELDLYKNTLLWQNKLLSETKT